MRWGTRAIAALLALACVWGAACGGGSSNNTVVITTSSSFPQGFLPLLLGGSAGSGDVAFRVDGDLYAVKGTSDVTAVSRADGVDSTFASVSGRDLLSIAVADAARLFVGDDAGRITAIPTDANEPQSSVNIPGGLRITGLAVAPAGFGDFGGQLFAAVDKPGTGAADLWRVTTANPLQAVPFPTNPPGDYVDLAFSGTTLLAINGTGIVTVSASGATEALPNTPSFTNPVGITVDSTASEIYVADAGDDVLYTVPVAGGARTARAAYDFDPIEPSGLAYDGLGAIAFITSGPLAIRGSALPRIDPNFGVQFSTPTVGYGDLELDRAGAFVLAANDVDDPPADDSINNFLFSVSRDASAASALASGVGSPLEELLGVAVDPKQQVTYFSTRNGNVYERDGSGTVTELVPGGVTDVAVLGLELAPAGFGNYGGWLIAATSINTDPVPDTGEVFAIDPQNPTQFVKISLTQPTSNLSDLVFSTDGVLYVVDNNGSTSRILRVTVSGTTGTVTVLPGSAQLGRADGIEIDEGGNRLLVASETGAGGQLLAVDLDSGAVTALANFAIDNGFLPTGIVYDRLGTVVLREGNNVSSLRAVPIPLPIP